MRFIIGLDLGTTSVKALLFDESGSLLAESGENDELFTPEPGWAEQDACHWLELSAKVIRNVVSEAGIDPAGVKALSVSSQGISSVPVDINYKPLRHSINWLDQRASKEMDEILSFISQEELYEITGYSPYPSYALPVIMWLKRNEPEVFSKTYKILLPHDFLCAHFTGNPVIDHTMAGGTLLYDIENQAWSDKLLDLFDIDRNLLSDLRWAGEPAGTLTEKAACLLGLHKNTLVVTGGQDQKIAAFGANLRIGSATISLGTCAALEFLFDHPPMHPERSFAANSYLEKGKWVLEACINTACSTITWAKDTIFPGMDYSGLDALSKSCTASGGVFFYPYLQGAGTPHNVPAFGAFTGITLSTTKSELARAIFLGIAMEIRINLESVEEAGIDTREIYVFGGGSKSDFLCQAIADVTGRTIKAFATSEMGAFGAAKLAAKAVGIEDFSLTADREWEPDGEQSKGYNELYMKYRKNQELVLRLE